MAGQAEVGALRVRLSMDSGEFERGTKDVTSSLDKLALRFGVTAGVAAAAGMAIGNAIGAAAKKIAGAIPAAIDAMDELSKMSQKIGIPTETLSALKHAADLANVGMETLSTGVRKLSVNMQEIGGGGTSSAAARSLDALGISATNSTGLLKSSEQVMLEIADRFRGMEDGAGKTAMAMGIFGKSGAELIPLLNEGSEGIRKMTDEAKELGITFDSGSGRAAEQFNDNMTRLGSVFTGFITKLTVEMLPTLARLSDQFIQFMKDTNLIDTAVAAVTNTFKAFVTVGVTVGVVFDSMTDIIVRSATTVKAAWETIPAFFEMVLKGAANFVAISIEAIVNDFVKGLAAIGYAVDAFGMSSLGDTITNSLTIDLGRLNTDEAAAKIAELGTTTAANLNGAFNDVTTNVKTGLSEIMTLWSGWGAMMEATAINMPEKVAAPIVQSTQAMAEAKRLHNMAMMEGKRITEEMQTPDEKLIARQQRLNELFAQGAISVETYGRAMAQASAFSSKNMDALASNVSTNLSKIFGESKGVAIATAVINTAQAVTRTLAAYPYPINVAMAALTAAAGAAEIATIRSTTKNSSGGGGGGSSLSGGGTAAAASSAGGGEASGGGAQQGVYITLNGETYGREQVRGLINQINEAVADGAVLRLAA
jgi:uncharacterized membrane protein YgcG